MCVICVSVCAYVECVCLCLCVCACVCVHTYSTLMYLLYKVYPREQTAPGPFRINLPTKIISYLNKELPQCIQPSLINPCYCSYSKSIFNIISYLVSPSESFLFRLSRGSGIDSLAGMYPVSFLAGQLYHQDCQTTAKVDYGRLDSVNGAHPAVSVCMLYKYRLELDRLC